MSTTEVHKPDSNYNKQFNNKTLKGYSLVMKPVGSGAKTLKIYGVYEDVGGKACIQRVSEVDENFKNKIKEILGSGGVASPEKNGVEVPKVVLGQDNTKEDGKINNIINQDILDDISVDDDWPKYDDDDDDDDDDDNEINQKFENSHEIGNKMVENSGIVNKEKINKFVNEYFNEKEGEPKRKKELLDLIDKIKDDVDKIEDDNSYNKNKDNIFINIYRLFIFEYNSAIQDYKLYKYNYEFNEFYINMFPEINTEYDDYTNIILNKYYEKIFSDRKYKNFESKIQPDDELNKQDNEYKIFAQNNDEYLLLVKIWRTYYIVYIKSPSNAPEETNTATTPAKEETEDDATKLAIAAAAISANTTNKGGGKTQKRLSKRKRSIVFSRRK